MSGIRTVYASPHYLEDAQDGADVHVLRNCELFPTEKEEMSRYFELLCPPVVLHVDFGFSPFVESFAPEFSFSSNDACKYSGVIVHFDVGFELAELSHFEPQFVHFLDHNERSGRFAAHCNIVADEDCAIGSIGYFG